LRERKTVVITGASDGIGAAAARRLHNDGHEVVIVGRSPEKTRAIAADLKADHLLADYSRLEDVRELASSLTARYPRIDVLANNAGGMFGARTETVDGFELTFQVNHLAPFLLTNLLRETLITSSATVIQTASVAARLFGRIDLADLDSRRHYTPMKAYGAAKLANILFTRELHNRLHPHGVNAAAFHPGVIASTFAAGSSSKVMNFFYTSAITRRFLGTPESGADQLVWLAQATPGQAWVPGLYYEKRAVAARVNPQSTRDDLAHELWERSAAMTGLKS
jgi:NAD(P)-dependent dehydrogenase (short-subunit alcohol dehydrogenase family)